MEAGRRAYSADAIVVLGGGLDPDGSAPQEAQRRVERAVALYYRKVAPYIVLSGGYGLMYKEPPIISEAEAMAAYIERLGISRDVLVFEDESRDTLGNAYFTKSRVLQPRRWTSIRVVTSDYHLFRADWVFRRILGGVVDFSFVSAPSGLQGAALIERMMQEARITAFYMEWFKAVREADDLALERMMEEEHFGYADAPSMTKEEMYRRLGEVARIRKIAGNVWWVEGPEEASSDDR